MWPPPTATSTKRSSRRRSRWTRTVRCDPGRGRHRLHGARRGGSAPHPLRDHPFALILRLGAAGLATGLAAGRLRRVGVGAGRVRGGACRTGGHLRTGRGAGGGVGGAPDRPGAAGPRRDAGGCAVVRRRPAPGPHLRSRSRSAAPDGARARPHRAARSRRTPARRARPRRGGGGAFHRGLRPRHRRGPAAPGGGGGARDGRLRTRPGGSARRRWRPSAGGAGKRAGQIVGARLAELVENGRLRRPARGCRSLAPAHFLDEARLALFALARIRDDGRRPRRRPGSARPGRRAAHRLVGGGLDPRRGCGTRNWRSCTAPTPDPKIR